GEGFESAGKVPYIEGPNGKVFKGFEVELDGRPCPDIMARIGEMPDPRPQNKDFLECVRTREKFALNEVNGHHSCTLVNMAVCALRLNRTLEFDPVTQTFINDPAANLLIDQPMRGNWKI
ncbi:MAG: gfo/Idh/MocA family oxidoreductase, partial [Muribaculaceae bacterium]|nr:gfo/Idh/MocA family oxidoreductase [Muribaculaceae bacterium]